MQKLVLAAIATATLLSGCGKTPVNVPAVKAPAAVAAKAAALTGQLVLSHASAVIKERENGLRSRQEWEVVGKLDGKAFSLSTSSFFPYYVPMLGDAKLNGKADALSAETSGKLVKLLKAAEGTAKQKQALHNLIYGLEFRSHRDLND